MKPPLPYNDITCVYNNTNITITTGLNQTRDDDITMEQTFQFMFTSIDADEEVVCTIYNLLDESPFHLSKNITYACEYLQCVQYR